MALKLFSLLIAFVTAAAVSASAAAPKRMALIIGISQYQHLSSLGNPVKDAKAIAGRLQRNGFDVSQHYDLSRADFLDVLETFQHRSKDAELALVYYAGHGMSVAGRDILAPADMQISCEPKEARRAVKLDSLFEAARGARNQIVLLDSCRNDPFPQCPTRSARAGTGFRGLSRITPDRGAMLIANATLSGALAADGAQDGHSPFATALLKRFDNSPKAFFRDLLDQVAQDVRETTGGQQIPEITSRGGSPKMCLSSAGCVQLAALPGAVKQPAPGTTDIQPAVGVFPSQREFATGETFADCPDCPQMVVVPAGNFTMGSSRGQRNYSASEAPAHKVTIPRAFAVSKMEITFDQWQSCTLEGGCNGYKPKDAGWGKADKPVIYVSWDDAKAYVEWLRGHTGKRYRLLSEAEWEYAARGGTTSAYATGPSISTDQANFDGSQSAGTGKRGVYRGKTTATGKFAPNPYGLHDLHGNVAEWVEDCWNKTHAGAPSDGSSRGGDCTRRVAKGGAWYFEPAFLRAAARMSFPRTKRLNIVGLRVARSLD